MEQTLAKVTRIQAGRYSVDDGRCIIKNNSGWLIVDANGAHDFGPVPTLAAAKEYVESGTVPLRQHNFSTSNGRRQRKKEFNAKGNKQLELGSGMYYAPGILAISSFGDFI